MEKMPTNKPDVRDSKDLAAEQFYSQVSESIKLVFDLTSRIDERVKMLVDRQNKIDEKMTKIMDLHQNLNQRVTVLETESESVVDSLKKEVDELQKKMQLLELKYETINLKSSQNDARMSKIFDWILKILFMLLGGWLLYKLGWQSPPTP
jgi:hypothetical protein